MIPSSDQAQLTLTATLSHSGLEIFLVSNSYHIFLKSLDEVAGLSDWFDDLDQVRDYILDKNNVIFREAEGVIEIVHRPRTKK